MNNPLVIRGIKLLAVAAGIAGLAGLLGTLLPDQFRWPLWGFGTVLFLIMLHSLWNWHRRGIGPAEIRPDNSEKARRLKTLTAVAIAVGLSGAAIVRISFPDVGSLMMGLVLGVFAAIALILSPLFFEPVKPKGPSQP